jgi:hypothetical protein
MNAETGTHGQLYASATSAPVDPHDRWNYQARGETPAQRLDRCYAELLQEEPQQAGAGGRLPRVAPR